MPYIAYEQSVMQKLLAMHNDVMITFREAIVILTCWQCDVSVDSCTDRIICTIVEN